MSWDHESTSKTVGYASIAPYLNFHPWENLQTFCWLSGIAVVWEHVCHHYGFRSNFRHGDSSLWLVKLLPFQNSDACIEFYQHTHSNQHTPRSHSMRNTTITLHPIPSNIEPTPLKSRSPSSLSPHPQHHLPRSWPRSRRHCPEPRGRLRQVCPRCPSRP